MATSTSRNRELSIARIIKLAFHHAGQSNPYVELDEAQSRQGQDLLETIVDELQSEGLFLRAVQPYDLQIEAGVFQYDLPDTILSVTGTAMRSLGDPAGGTTGFPVYPIGREEYWTIASKDAVAPPTKFFATRVGGSVRLYFWSVPDQAYFIRFQANYLLADNDDDTKTPDLERPWAQYLIWELAHQVAVANTMPVGRCSYLSAQAEKKKERCRIVSSEQTGFDTYISHRTPWSR